MGPNKVSLLLAGVPVLDVQGKVQFGGEVAEHLGDTPQAQPLQTVQALLNHSVTFTTCTHTHTQLSI